MMTLTSRVRRLPVPRTGGYYWFPAPVASRVEWSVLACHDLARDFKEFICICGMTHVKTSPYYPQSNGKMERWFKTLKGECIRVKTLLSLEDARRLVAEFVAYYNTVRLHSAIGYATPADKLAGRAEQIWADRRRKLAAAQARRTARQGIGPQSAEQGFAPSP